MSGAGVKNKAFRDYSQLLAAFHWLIDDLLMLEQDLCAASGQAKAHQRHATDRVALLASLDAARLAAALKSHPGSPRHRELISLLDGYWKRKRPLVGGRTWSDYARAKKPISKRKSALDAWSEEAWRREIEPRANVEVDLARTAWYLVLGTLTSAEACDAVQRLIGQRPRVDDVQKALDSRTAKSPNASREELRAGKLYIALGKRLDPLPMHIEKTRQGPRPRLLELLRANREAADLIARTTREGKSPVELLDAARRAGQPRNWKAVRRRLADGSEEIARLEPDK